MPIPYFRNLTDSEIELLSKAPAKVTVLIAGADQNIDKNETEWASKLVRFRTFTSDERLHDYYELVNDRFEKDLDELIKKWSTNKSQKQEDLVEKLGGLKPILAKMDDTYAGLMRDSLRSLARHVAKADGGLLGMGGISKAESALIDLKMLD